MFRLSILAVVVLTGLTPPVVAEIYRWTDENGKVHFGDKAPQNSKAEDVSETANAVNIDSSGAEQQKLDRLFPKEDEYDQRRQQADKQQRAEREKDLRARCVEARKDLRMYREGRFYFIDDEGNRSTITSKERDRRADELEQAIREHCSG